MCACACVHVCVCECMYVCVVHTVYVRVCVFCGSYACMYKCMLVKTHACARMQLLGQRLNEFMQFVRGSLQITCDLEHATVFLPKSLQPQASSQSVVQQLGQRTHFPVAHNKISALFETPFEGERHGAKSKKEREPHRSYWRTGNMPRSLCARSRQASCSCLKLTSSWKGKEILRN